MVVGLYALFKVLRWQSTQKLTNKTDKKVKKSKAIPATGRGGP
jgi:hypothetical protein